MINFRSEWEVPNTNERIEKQMKSLNVSLGFLSYNFSRRYEEIKIDCFAHKNVFNNDFILAFVK